MFKAQNFLPNELNKKNSATNKESCTFRILIAANEQGFVQVGNSMFRLPETVCRI